MVHVTSSQKLRRVETEDGRFDTTDCLTTFYPNFVFLIVLGQMYILVFYFETINRKRRLELLYEFSIFVSHILE
jgi:hypothetical protein